jgi:hypothetical protein
VVWVYWTGNRVSGLRVLDIGTVSLAWINLTGNRISGLDVFDRELDQRPGCI